MGEKEEKGILGGKLRKLMIGLLFTKEKRPIPLCIYGR